MLGLAVDVRGARATEVVAPDRGRRRLVHEPALDGLRGLAVGVVVLFHLDRLQGGFLGVDLFFVLSGYLITSLLVDDRRRTGSIGLGGFWARRSRRLVPALLVVLAGIAVLVRWFTPAGQRADFRGDALATLGYVANWHRMGASAGYWDMFDQPSPLDHMWSLAIEEQFYLVWPIVALLALGRRWVLAGIAGGGAVVSFGLLAWAYEPADTNRAYFGTDSRLGPTLLGAALAIVTAGRVRREGLPAWPVEAAGLLAVGWMAWSVMQVDGLGSWYYQGGLVTFAVASVVAVACFTGGPPGRVAGIVACPPLRWLGVVSYGVYLWHWPVIVYATPDRVGIDGVALDVARVGATLALAAASYVAMERPLRRRSFTPPRLRLVAAGAVAATLLAVVVTTRGPGADARFDEQDVWVKVHRHLPRDVPAGMPKLLFVGDSGVAVVGPELRRRGEAAGVSVGYSSEGFCSLVFTDDVSLTPSDELWQRDSVCNDERRAIWREMVARFDPDVVIHYLANAGTGYKQRLDGAWVSDCDPAYDAVLRRRLADDLELLQQGGARVLFATTPYAVRESASAQAAADAETDCRNATYARVVADQPGSALIELNAYVEAEREATGIDLFTDAVHTNAEGTPLVAEWLLTEI